MGALDEIVDALNIIAFEYEKGATRLLNRALQHGVKFSRENLPDISGLCAEKQKLRLPEDLREEQDEDEEATEQQDLEYEIQSAIDAADYALECLVQAQRSMNDSRLSVSWI